MKVLCVLHELGGGPSLSAKFAFQGYSLCGDCLRGASVQVVRDRRSMTDLLREAMFGGHLP